MRTDRAETSAAAFRVIGLGIHRGSRRPKTESVVFLKTLCGRRATTQEMRTNPDRGCAERVGNENFLPVDTRRYG
jgi:hypothetical protein